MDRVAWRASLPALGVILLTLVAYWPALGGGYVWDDDKLIVKNPDVRTDEGLLRVWFNRHSFDYFPLTSSMFWLEWHLFKGSAVGPHVINVLLHGLSAALLGIILQRLRVPGAWLAALLFALHPVAVASAAWLSERKNTLSMVFYLGSILAYLRFEDAASRHDDTANALRSGPEGHEGLVRNPHYWLSLGLFLLALLSKTSVVMLPLVLLLLAWWRQGKMRGRDLLRVAPFFALSLALGLVTIWFQWHSAVRHDLARPEGVASRIAAAGWIAGFYLYKLLLPVKLCAMYPRWEVNESRLLSFVPLALLAAATALIWAGRKRWGSGPLVAWAYFLVSLLPVLGFVDMTIMRLSLVADHLQYLAMPGILALAAALWVRATAGTRTGRAAPVVMGLCLTAMAALTFQRAGAFSSEQRLWRDDVEKMPRSGRAWSHLGMVYFNAHALDEAIRCFDKSVEVDPGYAEAYLKRGNAHATAKRYAEAVSDYDQAIAVKPDYAGAYFNRGNIRAAAQRYAEAVSDYDQAIALQPDFAEAYVSRGNIRAAANQYAEAISDYDQAIVLQPDFAEAYVSRGNIRAAANHYAEAICDYDQAIALKPDDAETWFKRSTADLNASRPEEALRDLDRAIAIRPNYAQAYINRGNIHGAANQYAEAIRDYDQAIALKPDEAEAWYNRGTACAKTGRAEEALHDLDRAISLKPDDAEQYYNRGNIHLDAGRPAEAIRDYDQAIALKPDYADAWYNRANAYASAGRPAEAIRDYSRAIELRPQDPDAYYNRAIVRRRLKQESEALADFQTARKLGGTAPEELLRSASPSAQPPR